MKKRAVFFDVDGTWYRWQLFHQFLKEAVNLGVLPRIIIEYTAEAERSYQDRTHRSAFEQFIEVAVKAYQGNGRLKGVRVEDFKLVAERMISKYGKRVHVFPRELAAAAKDCGYVCALVSGSPIEVIEAFAKLNHIDIFLGTEHPHDKSGVFFTGKPAKEWVLDKGAAVKHLSQQHGINLEESVAIGDTGSDIRMMTQVGYPVCFNPSRALLETAHLRDWPIVLERKDVIHRWLHGERPLIRTLPEPLLENLEQRLWRLDY